MNKSEIKKILLEAAGYPVSGGVAEIAEVQAEAIHKALNPKAEKPAKETASIEPEETR